MMITCAAITHQGRVRKNNEDAFLVTSLDGEEPLVNGLRRSLLDGDGALLAAVADGMGGAAAGEIASREGLASIAMHLFGHWGRFPIPEGNDESLFRTLEEAADGASKSVLRYSDAERTARGMGSTLTAVVLWRKSAYLCQVGDSRAYLFRHSALVRLTEDQTLVNEMIAKGTLSIEQAKNHPQRSMITQALGSPQTVRPGLGKVALCRGDRLLVCSDGLHGEVDEGEIQEMLCRRFSPRRTLEILVEAALAHGGRDNVTALLLSMEDPALPLPNPSDRVQVLPPPFLRSGIPGLLQRWRRSGGAS